MIEINPKIHDRFTLEFKVGFVTEDDKSDNDFQMNTWIYTPDTLDVNRYTYSKDSFYRDTRSYLRFITPSYTLKELSDEYILPYKRLRKVCFNVMDDQSDTNRKAYETEVKMFASIVKSSIRDGYVEIVNSQDEVEKASMAEAYIIHIEKVLRFYRNVRTMFGKIKGKGSLAEPFDFGDEFISNVVEQHVFRLAEHFQRMDLTCNDPLKEHVSQLLKQENEYRRAKGFLRVEKESEDRNRKFVYRAGQLKKYLESNLYLPVHKRSNTVFLEQVAFSFAAGISMVFATIVSFAFQQTYGNFTLPFFIALVISYMFKDRIKDLIRNYFANRLGSRFYDYVISLRVNNRKLGWCKEGFDFVSSSKISKHVQAKRARKSPLVIGKGVDEQVLQYRKKVHLHQKEVTRLSQYPLVGINEIIRYNLSDFMRKMDNPQVPLYVNEGQAEVVKTSGDKVYYINFVIQCKYDDQSEYRRYKVCLSQSGIKDIHEI
ncbi:MAG: hypothetical protein MR450_03505 [Prevotella sp.]|nr:hypothetical protein [Prevotella sp.]MDY4039167.1 hypothetical protein [Prevotella sp.]